MSKTLPDSFFCEKHEVNHRIGSAAYDACLPEYFEAQDQEEEVLDFQDSDLSISSFADGGEEEEEEVDLPEGMVRCVLKDGVPGEVTVASGIYPSGTRTFRREDGPFDVSEQEYQTVLNRGQKFFEKA